MFLHPVSLSYLDPPLECNPSGRETLSVFLATVSLLTGRVLGICRNTTKATTEKQLRPIHTDSIG